MKRVSLWQLAFLLPATAAIIIAWYSARANETQRETLAHLERCLENDQSADFGWLVQQLGKREVLRQLDRLAEENPHLVFDGEQRVAQLLPRRRDDDQGTADGYSLAVINGAHGVSCWTGPIGTRILSLEIRAETLRIELYGDLRLGSYQCSIPMETPDLYVLPWKAQADAPPPHDFHGMILKRHANELSRRKLDR